MGGIFISYRRDDQPGFVGRLSDALIATYGPENVFRDLDDIHPGNDFVAVLEDQLKHVELMLVIIGPGWLATDRLGKMRIGSSNDFVRREIHAALIAGRPIFPILVAGAEMPTETDLPNELRPLARLQAVTLADPTWSTDLARLQKILSPLIKSPGFARKLFTRRLPLGFLLLALIVGALLVTVMVAQKPTPGLSALLTGYSPARNAATKLPATLALPSRWTAQVTYDWGAQHEETFVFEGDKDAIQGTASYLRVARTIENAKLHDGQLTFTTHSQEILGSDPPSRLTHHYRGSVDADGLRLTLSTTGGQVEHTAIRLIAVPSAISSHAIHED